MIEYLYTGMLFGGGIVAGIIIGCLIAFGVAWTFERIAELL